VTTVRLEKRNKFVSNGRGTEECNRNVQVEVPPSCSEFGTEEWTCKRGL
jgi:hypothetical protein